MSEAKSMKLLYDLFVPGDPKGQPRARAFARGGHARVYDPGTAEGWKSQIALAFPRALPPAYEGPVGVILRFWFRRPKSHYRKSGALTASAPVAHVGKPDVDNLTKAVLDALTTLGVWRDDTQVVRLTAMKSYVVSESGCGREAGCAIYIRRMETTR